MEFDGRIGIVVEDSMILRHKRITEGQTGHDVGRELLTQMYREYIGVDLPAIATKPLGKPYFVDGNIHFSITHTKHHVFCALAETPVGIDAEELSRKVNPLLAGKILSPKEKEQYDMAEDQNKALLTFWVLKEAAGKCSGKGVQGYPNDTNFFLSDPRVQEWEGCLVAAIEEG